ncbi:MAG: EboA family metabolite traffic protein [Elainellaceae cyanobacterium]
MLSIQENRHELAIDLLIDWLRPRLTNEAFSWLLSKQKVVADGAERTLFTAFSSVPRHLGKTDLALSSKEIGAAGDRLAGWQPGHWSIDQAGRTLLVLAVPSGDLQAYQQILDMLFAAADLGEQVALYQALPLLPHPELHRHQGTEGIRSSMTAVFEAIALRNPYPASYFDENAWNQLVLKSLFVGSPLHLIAGLDRRANATLARMLSDYAHERWAAGRPVSPALWRCVGPFAVADLVGDLARAIAEPDALQRQAAALACAQSPDPRASALLAQYPELQSQIRSGQLTWRYLSSQLKPLS